MTTFLLLFSCFLFASVTARQSKQVVLAEGDFEYENPDVEWPIINPLCGGSRQSPINIITDDVMDLTSHPEYLHLYRPPLSSTVTHCGDTVEGTVFVNNDKVLQLNLDHRGWMISGSTFPKLQHVIQVHHHSPSEHQINGENKDLELHFVTTGFGTGGLSEASDLAVFGFMYEEGPEEDAFLAQVLAGELPDKENPKTINFVPHLDLGNEFYEYEGSLTTPGCWENVRWFLSPNVRSATAAQIAKFKSIRNGQATDNNNRPVQPLNGRNVLKRHYTSGSMYKAYAAQKNMGGGDSTDVEKSSWGGGSGSPITINFNPEKCA